MKKVIVLIFVLVCTIVLILSCSGKSSADNLLKFEFDKDGSYLGFSNLPSDYKVEDAKDDGYYVTQNLEVIANKNLWDNFVQTSLCKENTGIRMVKFYTDNAGSPFFLDLFYNDGYYFLFDSSAESQVKQPFLYMLTLKGQFGSPLKDSSVVVLTNDNTLTFDTVMKVIVSSNMDYIKSVSPFRLIMFGK